MSKYPLGTIDQLKAIQSLINMRKSADARETTIKGKTAKVLYWNAFIYEFSFTTYEHILFLLGHICGTAFYLPLYLPYLPTVHI